MNIWKGERMPTKEKKDKHKSYHKKWIKSEKGRAYRNKYRKENYRKRDWGDGSKKRYTEDEIELLLDCELTDTELAFKLKRSVQGIQGQLPIV